VSARPPARCSRSPVSIRRRSPASTTSSGRTGRTASIDNLGSYEAIVDKAFADKKNLSVGSRFNLLTSNGKTVPLEVKGVYKAPPFYPLLGEVSISLPFFDRSTSARRTCTRSSMRGVGRALRPRRRSSVS
jgi:hypothetical protein